MTVGNKVIATCGILVGLAVLLGSAALVTIHRLDVVVDALDHDALPGITLISRVDTLSKDLRGQMMVHIGASSEQDMARTESDIAALRNNIDATLKDYEKTISRTHDRELFEKIRPALDRFLNAWEPVRTVSRSGKSEQAFSAFQSSVLPAYLELEKGISDEVDDNKAYGDLQAADADRYVDDGKLWVWVTLLVSVLFGAGLSFFVVRSVNRTLSRSVEDLSRGADQVASAATQVASASQALAQGASEQASSLEETSASTNEISSMTHQNAENSRRAAEAVDRASAKIKEANRTLDAMVTSMSQINESSHKISKIINVIDEIAFQTNILSLNAAVEAARAGEAGMGFAVVADEVRNLAQRSAQAAKDTAALIEDSVAKSAEGNKKLNEVSEAILGITAEAGQVKTLVDEVSAASSEQTRGMDQIGKALVEMEQVTQRNAASSEQSASASEELSAQSQHMKEVVRTLQAMTHKGPGGQANSHGSRTSRPAKPPIGGGGSLKKATASLTARAVPPRAKQAESAEPDMFGTDDFTEF